MEIEQRLRELHQAEIANVRPADPGVIMDRGQKLKNRKRKLSIAVPLVVVAAAIAVVFVIQPGSTNDLPRLTADQIADTNSAISVTPATYDWNTDPATLGWDQKTVFGDSLTYVLSTAPGARAENFPNGNIPKAIYTTTDGTEWTTQLLDQTPVGDIAATGGLLYTVGTSPGANADSVDMTVGVSSDGGASFESFTVPLGGSATGATAKIVATPGGILAVGSAAATTDPFSLLPPDVLEGDAEPLILGEVIAVFAADQVERAYEACEAPDSPECESFIDDNAVYFATWTELGAENPATLESVPADGTSPTTTVVTGLGPAGVAATTHQTLWSADGSTYKPIPYPFGQGTVQRLFRLGDGAGAFVNHANEVALYVSDDARQWQKATLPGSGWLLEAGTVADSTVVVAQTEQSFVIYRADQPTGPYETLPLTDELGLDLTGSEGLWASTASITDAGIAIGVVASIPDNGQNPISQLLGRILPGANEQANAGENWTQISLLLTSKNLTEWSMTDFSGSFVDNWTYTPTGTLVGHMNVNDGNGQTTRRQISTNP